MTLSRYHCKLVKRCLLIVIIFPCIAGLPYKETGWSRSIYYILPTTGLATYALLLNFPSIVRSVHARPLYYDDLEDSKYVDAAIRQRFQSLFVLILQVNLTIIISCLIYYYYDRMHVSNLSKIELFGIFGGFISLLLKIENAVGKLALSVLNKWKLHVVESGGETHTQNIRRMRSNSLEIMVNI